MNKLMSLIILSVTMLQSCGSEERHKNIDLPIEVEDTLTLSDTIKNTSLVTCPSCGYHFREELPTEYCLLALDCDSCGYTMHPNNTDCCVFCTHGDVKCPSMQD